jgi:hypothetical protein
MSNEISYNFQILLNNGTLKDQYSSGSIAATQSVAALVRNVQNIVDTPAHTALNLGSVGVLGTPGFAVFQNLDLVNYIEIGIDVAASFHAFMKLKPGEQGLLRLGTAAPYALANSAPVDLFYVIYAN